MPCLAPVLSAAIRSQLASKATDQGLIGASIDLNLFLSQGNGKVGGIGRQFAASKLGGSGDLLGGGFSDLAQVVFGGLLDPLLFQCRFFGSGGVHVADFDIEPSQTSLDFGETA